MAQLFVQKNLDPDDVGQTARQLAYVQTLVQRVQQEALQPINQVAPLQNVVVACGTQSQVACTANVNWRPSSLADCLVYVQ